MEQTQLKNGWCKCDVNDNAIFFDDDKCSCGCKRHHYHCSKCGGITQIG